MNDDATLEPEELGAILACRQERDGLAMRLGAAGYEYHRVVTTISQRINESVAAEGAMIQRLLAKHGASSEHGDRIDLSTGRVVRSRSN